MSYVKVTTGWGKMKNHKRRLDELERVAGDKTAPAVFVFWGDEEELPEVAPGQRLIVFAWVGCEQTGKRFLESF